MQRLAERVAEKRVWRENVEVVMDKQVIRGEHEAVEVVERADEEQALCGTGAGPESSSRRADERRQPAYEHHPRHSKRDLVPVQQQECPHPVVH